MTRFKMGLKITLTGGRSASGSGLGKGLTLLYRTRTSKYPRERLMIALLSSRIAVLGTRSARPSIPARMAQAFRCSCRETQPCTRLKLLHRHPTRRLQICDRFTALPYTGHRAAVSTHRLADIRKRFPRCSSIGWWFVRSSNHAPSRYAEHAACASRIRDPNATFQS